MAQAVGQAKPCDKCGVTVIKAISDAGKRYTADASVWHGDLHGVNLRFLKGHYCNEEDVVRYQSLKKVMIEAGEMIVGQEVIVVKGRKVPLNTVGTIFWMETVDGFAYGDDKMTRIGFKDAAGTAYFIDAKNVIATNQMNKKEVAS